MSLLTGVHSRGSDVALGSSDRNFRVLNTVFVQVAHPLGGNVGARKTTETRFLAPEISKPLSVEALTQAQIDQSITWTSLNGGLGDFQQIQADGEIYKTYTTYDPSAPTRTTTRTSLHSGSSTSVSVAGFLVSETLPWSDGKSATYRYDGFGRMTGKVDARGRATRTVHNAAGQVISTQDHDGKDTIYSYYPSNHQNAGMLETKIDPLGQTTIYLYNPRGQVVSVGGTANYPLTYTYTSRGEMATLTTTNGQGTSVTKWEYHSKRRGLINKKTYGLSSAPEVYSYEYHPSGLLHFVKSSGAVVREVGVDVMGDSYQISEFKDGILDNKLIKFFNSYGQVNKISQEVWNPRLPSNVHTISYYETHHANGRLASDTRDSMSATESHEAYYYQHHLPFSSRVTYALDPENEARAQSHQIDVLKPVGESSAAWGTLGATEMTYGTAGRLATVNSTAHGTPARNVPNLKHTYTYHPHSAIPRTVTANNTTEDIFRSTHAVNRRGQITDVLSESLNDLGVLVTRTAVGYHYNDVGQRTKATREDGYFWQYGYNSRGEVTSAKKHQPGAGAGQILGGLQFEYQYDAIGNRTQQRFGGDQGGGDLKTVQYSVNSQNQYTGINRTDASPDHGAHYVTGMAGIPTSSTPNAIEVNDVQATLQGSFFYAKLTAANNNDPLVVPLKLEETPDGGTTNETLLGSVYVPRKNVDPTYEKGNLTNDGRWIYTWTGAKRLARMEPTQKAKDAQSLDPPILDFLYDWKGRRISKKVTHGMAAHAPSTVTSYLYDGWNIVATIEREYSQYGPTDLKIVRSVWGLDLSGGFQGAGGIGGLLATRTTDSIYSSSTYTSTETNRHFPSYDGNGNIIAWTEDGGEPATTRDFDAFGNVVTNQGTRWSASTAFGFSTKYEDVETGLLYYGYRYYDPVTGRWPSRDPIGERGGVNLYAMVGNNGVSRIDLLGLQGQVDIEPGQAGQGGGIEPAQPEINDWIDALQHYKSHAGSRVPAGQDLIDTIKESDGMEDAIDDLKEVVEKQVKGQGKSSLCPEGATGTINRKGGPLGVNTNNFAVGHVSFIVAPYTVTWKNNGCFTGFCNISWWLNRKLSFEDEYIFDDVSRLPQFFTDFLPHLVVGNGTPYVIYGSFNQSVDDSFNICCWGN